MSCSPDHLPDAQRDGKRFIVYADEKLTAFVELESAIHEASGSLRCSAGLDAGVTNISQVTRQSGNPEQPQNGLQLEPPLTGTTRERCQSGDALLSQSSPLTLVYASEPRS
jgi:hypothetical protein